MHTGIYHDPKYNNKVKNKWEALYIFAIRHIVNYDLSFLKTKGLRIGKIEEISKSPKMFKDFFELECDENQISKALKENSISIKISHKKKMENILSNIIIDRNYLVSLVMQTNLNHLARAFGYK